MLKALGLTSALVVDRRENGTLTKSLRNLAPTKYLAPEGLNVYDILNYPALVITKDAVKAVESRILGAGREARAGQGGLKGQPCAPPNKIIKRPS